MSKRVVLLVIGLVLMGNLLLMPVRYVAAQEEDTVTEEESTLEARGAGAMILMVGLALVAGAGFLYASREGGQAGASDAIEGNG